ncbi:MAG: phage holin family protein [Actinophytocola sp.]|uniref:phage holin family protein n=1 Tax=Actinophytocola sp. TaxID=1872138 RepID=UPI001325E9C6|nr:phage holin family protein [Actinophytocola sp.]MPZ82040.1 phage holin family protein [Actinophytocola sp.]
MAHVTSAHDNNGNGAGLPRVPSIPLSDETTGAGDQSIGNLVKDATTHLSTLVRAEVELARSEVTKEVKKGLTGSIYFILALVLLLLFIPFGLIALGLGINDMFDFEDHPWFGFLMIFAFIFVLILFFAFRGWRKVRSVRAPKRTIETVKDTAAVLRHRGDNGGDNGEAETAPVPTSGDAVRRV